MRRLLYPRLGYHEAKAGIDRVQGLPGAVVMTFAADEIAMRVRTLGTSRLPAKGRVIIAANHPTGLADGVALWRGLSPIREDLRILANGDALRIAPGLADLFIPVEWVKSRRNATGSRRVLTDIARSLQEEVSRPWCSSRPAASPVYGGMDWSSGLGCRPWLRSRASSRRQFCRCTSAPVTAGCSTRSPQISHELRDVTLFHELLNKRGWPFELTLGLPIDAAELPDDPADAARRLQQHVEYEVPRATRAHPRIAGAPGRRLLRAGAAGR